MQAQTLHRGRDRHWTSASNKTGKPVIARLSRDFNVTQTILTLGGINLCMCQSLRSLHLYLLICLVLIPCAFICIASCMYSSKQLLFHSSCSFSRFLFLPCSGNLEASSSRQCGEHPYSLVSAPCACWHGRHLCSGAAFQRSWHRAGTLTDQWDRTSSTAR